MTALISADGDRRVFDLLELLGALRDVACSNMPARSKVLVLRTIIPVIRGENPVDVAVLGGRKGKTATAARSCAMAWIYDQRKASGSDAAFLQTAKDFGTSVASVKAAYATYGGIARNLATLDAVELTRLVELTKAIWMPESQKKVSKPDH